MGTYRKIEVRTWSDDRFRRVSSIPACAQGLWLYLLTGPHTSTLPCAFRASRIAMADDLGWAPEAFDKAFAELFAEGMVKADFAARMLLLPNGCKYNRPSNPNVVIAWGKAWSDLPDCDLKAEALECVKACLSNEKEPFQKAFQKTFPMGSVKPSPNPSPKASLNGLIIQNRTEHSSYSNQEVEPHTDRVVLHPHARGRDLGNDGGRA
jgi:hypothetical protein